MPAAPDLRSYRAKRDPETTPEPFGEDLTQRALPAGAARGFVVQQHGARNMHWDLRLEMDGALVSFSVPRGPTLDPSERRLAVQTEDHPLEYADFEGVIPPGNYGAGPMIVWDQGSYHTVDGQSPRGGLESGKLDLAFAGHKLVGRFALVRTSGQGPRDWLLIRKGDPPAAGAVPVVERETRSVFSGRTVEELAAGHDPTPGLVERARQAGAPRAARDLARMRPMLAATADEPFSAADWLFEEKYDGMRLLACKDAGAVRLYSRSGRDFSAAYPELARAFELIPGDRFVVDGEVVATDAAGRSSFERLQPRFAERAAHATARMRIEIPVQMQAFDLLALGPLDLRKLPLRERKAILRELVPSQGFVRYVDHVDHHGEALLELAREHRLEGVMAKRAAAPYASGRRSRDWLKVKLPKRAPLVVVGYERGRGSRARLGALLLAWYASGVLTFAGEAGSGLDDATIDVLLERLRARESPADGLALPDPRAALPAGAVFVEPEVVVLIEYAEVTSAGLLRAPVFRALRDDLAPPDCRAPADREAEIEAAPDPPPAESQRDTALRVTHREKVFFPRDGLTKGDLLDYYEAVWPWLAPYLRDRPVVLTRFPDGVDGKSFFQKNAPDWTPTWVGQRRIDDTDYFICNDVRTLLHVINSGAIPLHVWSARTAALERPDWMILDLDPKGAPLGDVVEIARHIHRLLDEIGAVHAIKTSGQDGLHVLVPLGGALTHDESRALGEVLARVVCAERPEIATIVRPVAARGDRVYVDYLQNGRGKLIAAPYSVRPRDGGPVSMPLRFGQVTKRLDPAAYRITTVPRQLARHHAPGADPLAPVLGAGVDVPALLEALAHRLC